MCVCVSLCVCVCVLVCIYVSLCLCICVGLCVYLLQDYCQQIQAIILISPKVFNLNIWEPASHHQRTCITPSTDLHQNIRGPASHHLDLQ